MAAPRRPPAAATAASPRSLKTASRAPFNLQALHPACLPCSHTRSVSRACCRHARHRLAAGATGSGHLQTAAPARRQPARWLHSHRAAHTGCQCPLRQLRHLSSADCRPGGRALQGCGPSDCCSGTDSITGTSRSSFPSSWASQRALPGLLDAVAT